MPPPPHQLINGPKTTSLASVPGSRRSIRPATSTDLSYLEHLQAKWSNNLGFLPRPALQRYIDQHSILIVNEHTQHAGYLAWCMRTDGVVTIPQVAIEPELLRTTLGTRLLNRIARAAMNGHCSVLRLRSRSDLPANSFWPTQGFTITAVIARPTTRGLPIIEWSRPLLSPTDIATALNPNVRTRKIFRERPSPRLAHADLEAADA